MTTADRPVTSLSQTVRGYVRRIRRIRACVALAGRACIAPDVKIGPRARWLAQRPVKIGNDVWIGADFFLEAGLTVGDNVLISSRVACISNDHYFDDSPTTVTAHRRNPSADVVLEGDNLVGHGVIVIAPARIGYGTVVGAGSLVTGDLPPGVICVGRPARAIRARRPRLDGHESYEAGVP